jgi:hypothetical protein
LDPEIIYEVDDYSDKSNFFCVLIPSFEKVETSLKKAGKQSYLDDPVYYMKNEKEDVIVGI